MAADLVPNSLDKSFDKPVRYYLDGDIDDAISSLTQIASNAGSVEESINARLFQAQICAEIQDFACLDKSNVALLDLHKRVGDPQKAAAFWAQIDPSIIREFTWMPKFGNQNIPDILNTMNHVPFGVMQSDKYLLLQSSAVAYYTLNADYAGARQAVSRMAARAVVLPSGDYTFPLYLAEIVQDLYAVGDGRRAFLLVQKLDNFIRSSLPRNNPTHIRYLETTAGLMASFGNQEAMSDGLARLDAAEAQVHHLRISDQWIAAELDKIGIQRATLSFLSDNLPKAAEALANTPIEKRRTEIQAAGQFASYNELSFATVDLFLSRVSGRPIDTKWQALLNKRPAWETGTKFDEFFEMVREFGLGLATAGQSLSPDNQMLEKAAFDDVALLEEALFAKSHTFPVPDMVSRIIIGVELANLSRKSSLTDPERDFVVRAIDILQRSILHNRGDTMYLMSNLGSEKERRLAHTWLLLSDRRNELEISGLESSAQATWSKHADAQGQVQSQIENTDSLPKLRTSLVDLGDQLAQLPNSFGGSSLIELPGSSSIGPLLANNEVVVSEAAFFGTAYKVCIGPRHQFVLAASTIAPTLFSDLKLLKASLTATYAPSDTLDKEYPASAALRIRKFIFDGLDQCIGQATHIIYNPIVDLADVPLPALLDEIPPRDGDGYDLSHAAWLLNRYQFSYVSSVEEFVAARRLAKISGAEYPFLGVGDPDLTEPIIHGKTGGELLASRGAASANGPISSLPNLPETGDELRQVASLTPGAVLLLKDDATEANVLREPLGQYNVIEFATHGLVTGDLNGITEPGLVLTPTAQTETTALSDGFLSSTMLATLALRARLVVLSACNTANVEVDQFVGSIRGLTSALAESGVPTVLVSLWPVESDTSKRIVSGLYDQLKHGADRTVSGAFANATRGFLRTQKRVAFFHPRFWAPFVVYGDGGETLVPPPSAHGARLLKFDVGEDLGEIYQVTGSDKPGRDNALYDASTGAWNGKRFASFVERRTTSGSLQWRVSDQAIGAGRIVLGRSQIDAYGYLSDAGGSIVTPIIRSFDLNGHLLWTKKIDEGRTQSFVTDIAMSPSGFVWMLIDSALDAGKPDEAYSLHVLKIDPNGKTLESWAISRPSTYISVRPPTLALSGNGAYVFVPTRSQEGSVMDDFGDFRACMSDDGSEVVQIVSGKTAVSKVGLLPGVVPIRSRTIGSRVYLAGVKVEKCKFGGEPYFGRVDIASLRGAGSSAERAIAAVEIYSEKGVLDGQFTDFATRRGGFVLVGRMESRTTEFRAFDTLKFDVTSYSTSSFERTDSFLVELGSAQPAQTAKIHFVDAGTDLFANTLVANDNDVLLAGSVGSHPLWARYQLR